MTITKQDELDGLRQIGRIVANTMQAMTKAMQPGMSTKELDQIGRALRDREGAIPAPEASYGFPGTTCISVSEANAQGPRDVQFGAAGLVMAILGGTLMPLVHGAVMDARGAAFSYIVPALCFLVVAAFGLFDLRSRIRGHVKPA